MMDESTYSTHNEGTTQGQVIGDYATVHQHFYGSERNRLTPQHIWNVPYRRNPFFAGREQVLEQLHRRLTATQATALTQSQAISGLGGIGKTQIAVEYAYRHRHDYHDVLWVNAATLESIIASFLELATLFELPQRGEADQNIIVAAVKQWFAARDRWLLIFDNADDLTLIEAFLPTSDRGWLLLTTRDQATGNLANGIVIPTLDTQEGMTLLLRRAGLLPPNAPLAHAIETDQKQAEQIVQTLGGLPLALDQAAAYIEETGCSLTSYLERYHREQATLLQRRGRRGQDHPLPVATTWSLSFAQVKYTSLLAADLLRVCAFLAPDEIAEEILLKGAPHLGLHLTTLADKPAELDEAIGVLRRYSLVQRNRENHVLSIHRLVQAVLQLDMEQSTRKTWAERVVRAVCWAFPIADYSNWLDCERILPHALACAILINTYSLQFREVNVLLNQAGYYLDERGRPAEAESLFQRSLAIAEKVHGLEHLDVAATLINLASLYYHQGKYAEAESLFQRALAIRTQILGPLHADTAMCLDNLAVVYVAQRKYAEAETLHQRALAINIQVLGTLHPDTAKSLDNLAALYKMQEKYAEAETLYQRALTIREQVLNPLHPDIANSLNNLAALYNTQGKSAEAESLYQRALTIKEQALGPDHPDTAIGLNNLAGIYYERGEYEQAEPLLKRSLAISERVLGSQHPNTAHSLNNLAALYARQAKFAEAEQLYQRALAIREQVLGPLDLDTAHSLNNLAGLYESQGKFPEAELLYHRALTIFEQVLGQQHPFSQTVRENYAVLQTKTHQKKRARLPSLLSRFTSKLR